MGPRVFIVQDAGRNYVSADAYGELMTLVPTRSAVIISPETVSLLHRMLASFRDDDFLLLTGDPLLIGMACAIAAQANEGRIKALRWDRQEHRYFVTKVDMNEPLIGDR